MPRVGVGVGARVGVEVIVGVGVSVGPNNGPGPQLAMVILTTNRLTAKRKSAAVARCLVFIVFAPDRNAAILLIDLIQADRIVRAVIELGRLVNAPR
jgi:hypothetical protein